MHRFSGWGCAALVGGSLALLLAVASPARAAGAEVCAASCDADCTTCCRSWSLQAVCGDGTVAEVTGNFDTAAAAVAAAQGSPPSAQPCATGPALRVRPYCAPENAVASPIEDPVRVGAVSLLATLGQRQRDVREASAALVDFAEKRLLNGSGQKRIGDVSAALRQARAGISEAVAIVRQLRARPAITDTDVSGADKATAAAKQAADDAVGQARALMGDATIIDTAAEAKLQQVSAAMAAAKAREEAERAKQAEAKRQRDEAEERRRQAADAAESARKAAAAKAEQDRLDAIQKAKVDAERAKQAAAMEALRKVDADKQAAADAAQKQAAAAAQNFQSTLDTTVGMTRQDLTLCSDTIAGLTMVDMQSGASKEMKARAVELRSSIENEKDKLREVLTRANATRNKLPQSAAFQDLQAVRRDALAAHQETASLVASAHAIHP